MIIEAGLTRYEAVNKEIEKQLEKQNKVTVKEKTCYVDFSKEFLNKQDDITDKVAIYSVVNTLIELPNVNKVQFSIDGEQVLKYNESMSFGEPFERNLDIVKEKK